MPSGRDSSRWSRTDCDRRPIDDRDRCEDPRAAPRTLERDPVRGGRSAFALGLACALALSACAGSPPADGPAIGPADGTLILAGGGALGPEIMGRFVELAGGPDARIVVIPTASERDSFPEDWRAFERLRSVGARNIALLHTRDTAEANSPDFVEPLRSATGVWIPGGRQWRLADAYLGTRVLDELRALLERGGVIGGTSAGASIQPSYMVRGAPEGNHIMMAEGHERGFAFLRDVAVDQHLIARGRERDLLPVIERYPALLGIGLDEGTAIVVRGDTAEVIGVSRVAVYAAHPDGAGRAAEGTTDGASAGAPGPDDAVDPAGAVADPPADAGGEAYFWLEPGDRFDLAARRILSRADPR